MRARSVLQLHLRISRALCTAAPPGNGPNHRSVMALDANTIRPFIQPNAHIAPDATVLGSVTVNDRAAVMCGATLRGDLGLVEVGIYSVVGEGATLVASGEGATTSPRDALAAGLPLPPDTSVGDYCRVGAGAVLRSCTLEGENEVGDGAVIGSRVTVGRGARVAPRAVVPDDTTIGENEVWAGNPAVKVDTISPAVVEAHSKSMIEVYNTVTIPHAYEFLPTGTAYWEKEKLQKAAA